MDSVDKVILVSPFLGVVDVISTLYVESIGYSLSKYEAGFLARVFVDAGFTYLYIPVYLSLLSCFAYTLWCIKNKKLDSSRTFDKILFFLIALTVCYIYARITEAFIGNFLLPYRISGRISWTLIRLFIYLSTTYTLILYLWRDVALWVSGSVSKKG
ncbi:MAG: hypothetical protein QXV21_02730 [Candidatus Bathyarchaeia archaeon]